MMQKLLLVGPYPPPHGGVSVHVWSAHARMKQGGAHCKVLNVRRDAPPNEAYIKITGARDFLKELIEHVNNDWVLHVHTNGHNLKSWLVALICGVAAQMGPGGLLTLHSGILPAYLYEGSSWRRLLARLACVLYNRVICVNEEIAAAIASLGIAESQLQITPAYLPMPVSDVRVPAPLEQWLSRHRPVLTATMFFRPEYGFELLVQAISILRRKCPQIGCLVMGSGEGREVAKADDALYLAGDVSHDLCLILMSRSSLFVRPTFRDGDSISVREALSLGIPVVASNVGTRPPGVMLFEAGDVNGLVKQIDRAIKAREAGDAALATGVSPWVENTRSTMSPGGAAQVHAESVPLLRG